MKDDFSLVWKTHDFIIAQLVEQESSFEFMFKDLEEIVALFKSNLIDDSIMEGLFKKYIKGCLTLINLYKKHTQVLKEMQKIIEQGVAPKDDFVGIVSIMEMKSSNEELIQSVKESINMLNIIKKQLLN